MIDVAGSDYPMGHKPLNPKRSALTQIPGDCTAHDGYFVIDPPR